MIRLTFQGTLLTDLVLSSRAATEGFQASLDYIPGAKFLGLVARKLYDMKQPDRTLDLFHNGSVRFGDAHPATVTGVRSFRVPLSWNGPKGKGLSAGIYLHHTFSEELRDKLKQKDIQLKQIRGKYLTEDHQVVTGKQNFSIKSAFDRETRNSREGQMYGYFALQSGTLWRFFLDLDDPQYADLLKNTLVGQHRIGRSKTAEYGLIDIELVETVELQDREVKPGQALFYAASNWCFYDDHNRCTLQPEPKQIGLPADSKIIWDKSQIRTRTYSTWNQKRSNRDADRQIIEKGSVLAIELSKPINTADFQRGIGAHRSEGFGQVLINPDFLDPTVINEQTRFEKVGHRLEVKHHSEVEVAPSDELVLAYLDDKAAEIKQQKDINQLVNEFITNNKAKYRGITASQWGQVRNIAKNVADRDILWKLLFNPVEKHEGYFFQGQSENQWRQEGRRVLLEKHLFGDESKVPEAATLDFMVKLAAEMAKAKQQ